MRGVRGVEPPFFSAFGFGAFGAADFAGLTAFGAFAFLSPAFFSSAFAGSAVSSAFAPASFSPPLPVTRRRAFSRSDSFFSVTAFSAAFFSARRCAKSKSTNSMIAFSAASPGR